MLFAVVGEFLSIPPVTNPRIFQPNQLAINIYVIIIGPFFEELLYRFAPINIMKKRIYLKIFIIVIIFTFLHITPSYGVPFMFIRIIPIFLLAISLSFIYLQTGSLLLICVLHMFYNSLVVLWDISFALSFPEWNNFWSHISFVGGLLQSSFFLFTVSLMLFAFCLFLYARIRLLLGRKRLADYARLSVQPVYSNWLIIIVALTGLETLVLM
ncbi:CPBP family glutamic-type intramembrane protease [Spirochaeta dissipatitropha]